MQWTNSKSADVPSFRQSETNDVTIMSCEASPRPDSSTPSEVIQTFKASYKRPFKGSDVNYDIDLEPATDTEDNSASIQSSKIKHSTNVGLQVPLTRVRSTYMIM